MSESVSGADYSRVDAPNIDDTQFLMLREEHLEESAPLKLVELLLLTCPSLGLQVCWFLLTSSGTPFLLSLGISNSVISLVWVTGPVFGAFAQPVLGVLSDGSRNRWGKRKPFIVSGAACATTCQLALAYAWDLTSWTAHLNVENTGIAAQWLTQAFALFCVIIITFALQVYAVGVRTLIVDNCPPGQQHAAAAWAMRWNVLGNLLLSSVGFVNAQWSLFGNDINTVFKTLAIVATICSYATVGLTCFSIPDTKASIVHNHWPSLWQLYWSIVSPTRLIKLWAKLPPISRQVCTIQLFAWAGWFPVLYYLSTYAYEIALSDSVEREGRELGQVDPILLKKARTYSFFASFAFAFGTFVAGVALQILERATPASFKLPRIWFASQFFLGCCLQLTFVSRTGIMAIIIVAMVGFTAPVTMWVPFALISTEVSELYAGKPDKQVGWIMGMHNMAISLPQIGSTLFCALFLAALKLVNVVGSVAWMFRLASVAVFYSAYLIHGLR